METSLQILPRIPSIHPSLAAKQTPSSEVPKEEQSLRAPEKELSTSVPEGTEKTWPNSDARYIEYERGDLTFAYLLDDHPNASKEYSYDSMSNRWEAGNIIVGFGNREGPTLNSVEELKSFSESLSASSSGKNLDGAREIGLLLHEHAGRSRHDFSSIDLSSATSQELEEVSEYLLIMEEVSMAQYRMMKAAASDAAQPTDYYQYFQRAAMDAKGSLQVQNFDIAAALKTLRAPAGGLNVKA